MQQISDAFDRLKQMGVSLGRSGALHIYFAGKKLSDEQTKNLINVQLGHEDLLYRVARGGGRGRRLGHKFSFAKPISTHIINDGYKNWHALNYHRLGMNTSTGQVQFRYFDASLNAAAVQANVSLVMGMVGAAMDGRLQDVDVHRASRLGWLMRAVQDNEGRWNRFVTETVGAGPIADQLKTQL